MKKNFKLILCWNANFKFSTHIFKSLKFIQELWIGKFQESIENYESIQLKDMLKCTPLYTSFSLRRCSATRLVQPNTRTCQNHDAQQERPGENEETNSENQQCESEESTVNIHRSTLSSDLQTIQLDIETIWHNLNISFFPEILYCMVQMIKFACTK